jgi:hypothetical protein
MKSPVFRCHARLAALLVLAGTAVPAGVEPQASGNAPAFVDFRAVTAEGEPVADLKTSDVTLRVDGRARTLKSLELVRVGRGSAPAAASALPPPFVTNADTPSGAGTQRELLIVLDELSISPGKEAPVRESVNKLLSALTPADRVGVLSTRQGGPTLQFTEEHQEAFAALAKFAGYAPARLTESDFACNALLVLNTLRGAYAQFSPGSAPTLVFVSAAVAGPQSEQMANIGKQSELCPLRTNHFDEVGAIAVGSRANTYVVQALEAGTASISPQDSQAGVDAIAGSTGAETIRMTGGATDTSLVRVARETSAYYLASFEPEAGDRSGNRLRVDVRVARDDIRVFARPNIVVARAGGGGGKPVTPRDMIRVNTQFSDLPLRGAVYPSRFTGNQVRLVVLFEPAEPAAKLTAATVVAFDAKGTGRPWHADAKELAGTPIRTAVDMQPGQYRVRIAATDAQGRAGSLDVETDARLSDASPLTLSALVLGVPSSGSFAPRLTFTASDAQAIGYVEIYGVPKGGTVGVTFELAATDGGPALATGPAQISQGSTEDMRIAFGGFGIGPMEPGDLQMRAVVSLDGKRVGSVSRTVRKK